MPRSKQVQQSSAEGQEIAKTVSAAFGAKNRERLITEYFRSRGTPVAADAWRHVYRLLLWIDQTTGLAHCYESDKSQPGKHWYPRSLAFHDWLASSLAIQPARLGEALDCLFRSAASDLARHVLASLGRTQARAKKQREPYDGRDFPQPGEDRELIGIITETLSGYIQAQPPPEKWRELIQRVRQYVSLENKRKNLVGEGFEDVLVSIISRTTPPDSLDVSARKPLQNIPGFRIARAGDKENKVDVAIYRPRDEKRILITAKWSIRADREKQFPADFAGYVNANANSKPFDYVLITNEFDPARLVRACEAMAANSHMFASVVHISTEAVKATYGASMEPTMQRVRQYISDGRLISLGPWLESLP